MNKTDYQIQKLDEKLKVKVNENFSGSLMSNSKWIKLINLIVENSSYFKKIEFKKVLDDKIGTLFINSTSKYEFDYWSNGIEGANSFGGWILYKEIEFIKFPEKFGTENQNLKIIRDLILEIGKFELTEKNNDLILHCYK